MLICGNSMIVKSFCFLKGEIRLEGRLEGLNDFENWWRDGDWDREEREEEYEDGREECNPERTNTGIKKVEEI